MLVVRLRKCENHCGFRFRVSRNPSGSDHSCRLRLFQTARRKDLAVFLLLAARKPTQVSRTAKRPRRLESAPLSHRLAVSRDYKHPYEEFTRLAETRLAQNILNYSKHS